MTNKNLLPLSNQNLPKEADTLLFDIIERMVYSTFKEMKEFSGKRPNETISPIKAASLNKLCEPIKRILKKEPYASFLDLIDLENLPSYSDTILLLINYQTAMKSFRASYFGYNKNEIAWFTKENPGVNDESSQIANKEYYQENFNW